MTSFSTINTALSGLQAQQHAMEVTGHNVTNANTPGFHRQEAVLSARLAPWSTATPTASGSGFTGAGVDVTSVRRMQGLYFQQQMNAAEGDASRWTAAQEGLQRIEGLFGTDTTTALYTQIDTFFASWQQLSANPENEGLRYTVRGAASMVTSTLHTLDTQLSNVATDLTTSVSAHVTKLNDTADALAKINGQIAQAQAGSSEAADLLDQRDQLLAQLAGLAGVTGRGSEVMSAELGGHTLVQGTTAHHLSVVNGVVTWDDGATAQITRGSIGGALQVRDTSLPAVRAQLDAISSQLAGAVNARHATGRTLDGTAAGAFFSGTTAADIRVASAIQNDVRQIAAGTTGAAGDGTLAQAISDIADTALVGSQTISEAAQGLFGTIGQAVSTAKTNAEMQTTLRDGLQAQQDTISGVSLDEEMANMLIFQRAYDASARVLTAANEMMETLLSILR
jgi:flagellar hook-associated protein 1 FlgK